MVVMVVFLDNVVILYESQQQNINIDKNSL